MNKPGHEQSSPHPLLEELELICLDCETTGLDTQNDRVVELAVIRFKGTEVLESWESLVDPGLAIPETAQKIHQIDDAMVQGKPSIGELLPALLATIGSRPIIGHGIGFDLAILEAEAKRHHVLWPAGPLCLIDTLRLARLYGQAPVNSLSKLREHFNIPEQPAHRAMNDVQVNIAVFAKLTSSFRTLAQIQDALSKPIAMRLMPLGKHKGRELKEVPLDYLRWAAGKEFDQDLLFSIRQEIKKRQKGLSFNQASNPFLNL